MRFTGLVVLGLILALSAPGKLFAAIILPEDIGATFSAGTGATPATAAYDATTDIFTVHSELGRPGDPAVIAAQPAGPIIANDILGSFSLSAMIDGTGTLLGGSYSWIGQSATLGIGTGTVLIAGTLLHLNPDLGLSGPQFLANLTTFDPLLEAAVGPVETLLIGVCCLTLGGLSDPWSASWGPETTASSAPDLFGTPNRIPEPAALTLFSVALIGLGLVARRRRQQHGT